MEKKSVYINRPTDDPEVVISRHGFLNYYDKYIKEFTGKKWINGGKIGSFSRDS